MREASLEGPLQSGLRSQLTEIVVREAPVAGDDRLGYICSPSSQARKSRPGRGLGEVAVHMIPSPIHFLAYNRPFRPGVEPREPAVDWNYNSGSAYVFGRGGRRRF